MSDKPQIGFTPGDDAPAAAPQAERAPFQDPKSGKLLKGHAKRGGRKPGVQNVMTRDLKELVRRANEYGAQNAVRWLQRVAKRSPGRALLLTAKFMEFNLPKLQRTEMVGKDGGPVVVEKRIVQVVKE